MKIYIFFKSFPLTVVIHYNCDIKCWHANYILSNFKKTLNSKVNFKKVVVSESVSEGRDRPLNI